MTKIVDTPRAQIESFLDRAWALENESRSAASSLSVDWGSAEYGLGAYDDGELVGSAIFRVRGGVAHLSNVIVAAERRRSGIGGALVDTFVDRARALGCHKLTLTTDLADVPVAFYKRHGFAIEAILRDDAYHFDRCVMSTFLTST